MNHVPVTMTLGRVLYLLPLFTVACLQYQSNGLVSGLRDDVTIALGFQPYVTHFSLCLCEVALVGVPVHEFAAICPTYILVVALYSDAQIGGRLIS